MSGRPPITLLREVAAGPGSLVFMGRVEEQDSSRLVAVKVLSELSERSWQRAAQIRDQHRLLARLRYRHLVCVEGAAEVQSHPALVSKWVDGLDLLEWLAALDDQAVAMPARVVCEILRGAAATLDTLGHRSRHGIDPPLGLVHGDLKPSNLMVDRDGELKVLDVGSGFSALAVANAPALALKTGIVRYLSPQRRDGGVPGPTDDIYGLGILALELFRGRWLRRLRAKNPAHDRQLSDIIADLGKLRMRTDADNDALRSMLLRMVAFDPDARPPAAEVAQTFRTLADHVPGASLESFAHTHLVPLLGSPPIAPDPELAGRQAVWVGSPPPLAEVTATSWSRPAHDPDDEASLTEDIANETARALRALGAEVTPTPPAADRALPPAPGPLGSLPGGEPPGSGATSRHEVPSLRKMDDSRLQLSAAVGAIGVTSLLGTLLLLTVWLLWA